MTVYLELPDDLALKIAGPNLDLSRLALEGLVAEAYREGNLTMEHVRQLLGFSTRMQVDQFLGRHAIFDYTLTDLVEDRQTLKHLHGAP